MENEEVLSHLTDEQLVKFLSVYNRHQNAFGSEERLEQVNLKNIEKVEWVEKEKVFHVFYKETKHFRKEWWHYNPAKCEWW